MAERLPAPRDDELSPRQREIADGIRSGPRGELVGPFTALLRSPEICARLSRVGEFLRFGSVTPDHLVELAILCVARHWDQDFEWGYHQPIAVAKGVPQSSTDAIAAGREPDHPDAESAVVWRLVTELLQDRQVCDETYHRAVSLLGEESLIELVATAGYYTTLAMVMNTALTSPPPDSPRLPSR